MRAWMAVIVFVASAEVSAQEPGTLTKSERVFTDMPTVSEVAGVEDGERAPDYSRKALLEAMWTDPFHDEDVPRAPETFNPFQFKVFGQTFRFMPFLASSSGPTSATPFEYVDPFAGAPVSAAYTPATFRDRFWEWRMRRRLEKTSDK